MSVAVHLAGLHLVLVRGVRPPYVAPMLQRLASGHPEWPDFEPPRVEWRSTVFDAAIVAGEFENHIRAVKAWSASLWEVWSAHHAAIGAFVEAHLGRFWRSDVFTMQAIGHVRSGYQETTAIPKGPGAKHEAEGVLEILPELARGLQDVEGFSHLFVIWAFDRAEPGDVLEAWPPTDDRPHGVFATRSPQRPNPIGLTVVELLRRDGNRLHVRGLDMLDGTPILDIKPYLTNVPEEQIRRGWLAEAEARRQQRQKP